MWAELGNIGISLPTSSRWRPFIGTHHELSTLSTYGTNIGPASGLFIPEICNPFWMLEFCCNFHVAVSHVHSCREKWKYAIPPFHCGKFLLFLSIPVKITYKCIVYLIPLASGNTHFSTCRIDLLNSYFRFVVYVKNLFGAPDRDSFCLSYFTQPIFTLLFSFSTRYVV